MKDLVDKILMYIPQYLTDFGLLFSGPKRFLSQKDIRVDNAYVQALLFLGISLVFVVIMEAPLLPPGKDIWGYLGTKAIIILFYVSLFAVALRLAWRLVGGKATVRCFFIIYAYVSGVCIIIRTLFVLLSNGFIKVHSPELYLQMIEAELKKQLIPDLLNNPVIVISLLIYVVGFLFIAIWTFIVWGAYRELNGLSKRRSFLALMIMGVLSSLIELIMSYVSLAMM